MATYDNIKFTKGSDIVYIGVIQVEENIINAVKVITYPTTDSTPEVSKLLNLNRVEKRFTINGVIIYGKLNDAETKISGKDKKDLLKTMFAQGSVVTMNYESTDYSIAVEKFNIKDKAHDGLDAIDGEVVYNVIITCVYGKDII